MPDTLPTRLPTAAPIHMQRADGFLVVSRRARRPGVPPFTYSYRHEYLECLNEASDCYDDYDRGERGQGQWEPVAIMACRGGVPFAELGHLTLTRLCKERGLRSPGAEADLAGDS